MSTTSSFMIDIGARHPPTNSIKPVLDIPNLQWAANDTTR